MSDFEKKRAVGKLACGLAVIIAIGVLLIALSTLFYPKNNQQAFGMNYEVANGVLGERNESIDVLFTGDSEAFSSFSPLQMWKERGFTSYVCAIPSQQLPYGNTLLHRATRNQSPRVVVIETNTVYAPFTVNDALFRVLQDALPVFEFHDRWKTLNAGDLSLGISTTWSDDLKGFRINRDVKAADASGYMAPDDRAQEIPGLNKAYLESMIGYCRSIGAEPVLVSTPSAVNWNMARHNGIQAFASQMAVSYIDLNTGPTKIDIDWERETHDGGDHLNLSGAQKVSAYIGEHLATLYDLPDHRDDRAFDSWDDCLKRYEQRMGEAG